LLTFDYLNTIDPRTSSKSFKSFSFKDF